jgi:hypothetical protein
MIEVPSNPVASTWGLHDTAYTFRADWVRDAFKEAGIRPTAKFAEDYFTTAWVRPENPFSTHPDDPNDSEPPDFHAPDPPGGEGEHGPGEE